jgi:hypothetical protein
MTEEATTYIHDEDTGAHTLDFGSAPLRTRRVPSL